ncbi:MAG TPA: hypothetical protein DDW93_11975, partial [Firmicutes bacterium]|nr:hypothetical protein [Bacillota bacterium]
KTMDKNMNTWVKEITLNKEVQPMPIMTYPGLELMSEKNIRSSFLCWRNWSIFSNGKVIRH